VGASSRRYLSARSCCRPPRSTTCTSTATICRTSEHSRASSSRNLGIKTPLERYPTTALGASEINLLELANAYRTMASGIEAEPYVIRAVRRDSEEILAAPRRGPAPLSISRGALSLIQEGLRGVVRLPTGTAHALASRRFPIAVMGKTGTTSDFRDAIFVGSTYGPEGITAAVRIGFDDNRSLGSRETGSRLALPVFQELMLGVYKEQIVGAVPSFPASMEGRITASLLPPTPPAATDVARAGASGEPDARPFARVGLLGAQTAPAEGREQPRYR
jgi:penicillin-binding protein 1A